MDHNFSLSKNELLSFLKDKNNLLSKKKKYNDILNDDIPSSKEFFNKSILIFSLWSAFYIFTCSILFYYIDCKEYFLELAFFSYPLTCLLSGTLLFEGKIEIALKDYKNILFMCFVNIFFLIYGVFINIAFCLISIIVFILIDFFIYSFDSINKGFLLENSFYFISIASLVFLYCSTVWNLLKLKKDAKSQSFINRFYYNKEEKININNKLIENETIKIKAKIETYFLDIESLELLDAYCQKYNLYNVLSIVEQSKLLLVEKNSSSTYHDTIVKDYKQKKNLIYI